MSPPWACAFSIWTVKPILKRDLDHVAWPSINSKSLWMLPLCLPEVPALESFRTSGWGQPSCTAASATSCTIVAGISPQAHFNTRRATKLDFDWQLWPLLAAAWASLLAICCWTPNLKLGVFSSSFLFPWGGIMASRCTKQVLMNQIPGTQDTSDDAPIR